MKCENNSNTYTIKQIEEIKKRAKESMTKAIERLRSVENALDLFFQMKFEKTGFNPLSTEPCNLLEQINQVFTVLMSCYAATCLIDGAECFEFAFAEKNGRDLVAYNSNGDKIAEAKIFTAVSALNNGKLRKEINRLRNNKDIAPGTKRMVIYTANGEVKKLPDDAKVIVKFCSLTDLKNWIQSE